MLDGFSLILVIVAVVANHSEEAVADKVVEDSEEDLDVDVVVKGLDKEIGISLLKVTMNNPTLVQHWKQNLRIRIKS